MSDHLIAEANRHARALDERNDLVVELNLLRQWQRETIQNARGIMKRALLAHHAERIDAIARAKRAEAELATERARLDWVFRNCKVTADDYTTGHRDVYAIHDREDLGAAMKEGAQ